MGKQAKALIADALENSDGDIRPASQRQPALSSTELVIFPTGSVRRWHERYSQPLEVAALVALSAVLHAGAAYGFYSSEKAPPERRLSSVDIEFVRPPEPEPPKPEPPKPEPPKPEPPKPREEIIQPKPVVKQAVVPEPELTPPPPESPVDTGIDAESAEDGNLVAGKGGTGVPPVAPQVLPPPVQAAVAPPVPLVQAHEGANYARNPRPAYPARARREGWQGKVILRVQVLPNGRAGQISIQTSAGRQQLDDAAQAAVRGWTFVPARRGGTPTSGWVNVPIEFRLK